MLPSASNTNTPSQDGTTETDIARIATTRHTCKATDASRKIPAEQVEQLKTLLRYAPSSVNSQPWHFFIAETDAGKARFAKATPEGSPCAPPTCRR